MSGPSPDIALNVEMARLHHAGGLTLAQIGARYSLSKSAVGERIRRHCAREKPARSEQALLREDKMTESAIRAATDMLREALLRAIRNGAAEVRP